MLDQGSKFNIKTLVCKTNNLIYYGYINLILRISLAERSNGKYKGHGR